MDVVGLLLFAAAWVGHAALWLVSLNILYSRPIHKHLLKRVRLLVGLLVLAFPFSLYLIAGLDLARLPWWCLAYLVPCWIMTFLLIPVVTLRRQLRGLPAPVRSRTSRIYDVAQVLGYKPAGDGRFRRVALLPGNQVFQVEFSTSTVYLPQLPTAWDGLSILHLSDLHLCGTPDRTFYETVIHEIMAEGIPDIVALTGDLIDTDEHHRWLLPLLRPLRWKEAGLAILGNHDFWHRPARVRRRLARLGCLVLGNGWQQLSVRGIPLVAVGNEEPWFRPGPDLHACPEQPFRLCLSHAPDTIRWARRNRIDLMLSGHNHGGQIRLPLFGSLFVPSLYSRRFDCGWFLEKPTLLHVTRGIAGKEPLRYNCRPEIARIILRRLEA